MHSVPKPHAMTLGNKATTAPCLHQGKPGYIDLTVWLSGLQVLSIIELELSLLFDFPKGISTHHEPLAKKQGNRNSIQDHRRTRGLEGRAEGLSQDLPLKSFDSKLQRM